MTLQDLKLAAYNGITPPEPLSCPERAFFLQAKEIYAQYHDKRITQAESAEAMRQAIQDYKRDMVERQNGIDALQRIADLYKQLELTATAYRKDRTLVNADKLMEAIYGLTTRREDDNDR